MPPLRNKKGQFSTKGKINRIETGILNGKRNRGRVVLMETDDKGEKQGKKLGKTTSALSNNVNIHNLRGQFPISRKKKHVENSETTFFINGDRLINFLHIDKQLFCRSGKARLDLFKNIKKEELHAIGSIWHVSSEYCNHHTRIESSKRYRSQITGHFCFETNVKAVLGKLKKKIIRRPVLLTLLYFRNFA